MASKVVKGNLICVLMLMIKHVLCIQHYDQVLLVGNTSMSEPSKLCMSLVELTVHYDDKTEVARVGQLHYCPEGHFHWFENCTDHDVVYLAIVPTLG